MQEYDMRRDSWPHGHRAAFLRLIEMRTTVAQRCPVQSSPGIAVAQWYTRGHCDGKATGSAGSQA